MRAKMLNSLFLGLHPSPVKLSYTSEKNLIIGLQVPQLSCGKVFLTSTAPSQNWVLAAEAIYAGLCKQMKQRNSKAGVKSSVGVFQS